jgi:phage-related protein
MSIPSHALQIEFYTADTGNQPAQDFMRTLPPKARAKLAWTLAAIESLSSRGHVPATYFKKLTATQDIWEVRASAGHLEPRLLGFLDGPLLMLTHGFLKKSSKTPPHEIEVAEYHRKRYFRRKA